MFRRTIGMGAVALLLAALPMQAAASPEGPRLAVMSLSFSPPFTGLLTTGQQGGAREELVASSPGGSAPLPTILTALSWSPDGQMLAYVATVGQKRRKFSVEPRTKVFVLSADGGKPKPVPGTDGSLSAVFAPDGHSIAFSTRRRRLRPNGHGGSKVAYESEAIWLAGVDGTGKMQMTPWRNGLRELPASFSPDGGTLAATRLLGKKGSDAVAIALASGETAVLAHDAREPVYSPDGSRIALLKKRRQAGPRAKGITANATDLFVMRADGSDTLRLTRTPKVLELFPSWDPSGGRLAFTRFSLSGPLGLNGEIAEINPDGTCPSKVLSSRNVIFTGAAWQSGASRSAGPIVC